LRLFDHKIENRKSHPVISTDDLRVKKPASTFGQARLSVSFTLGCCLG
jgi:hypothetical protein